jgi:glucose/arabinose dehydrogenase
MQTLVLKAVAAIILFAGLTRPILALPPDFERKDWVDGFTSPEAMKFAPDGRLFVLEQAGKIRIIKNGVLLPTPFATVTTWAHRETMLGVAFDPKFAQNGYVYVYYSSPKQQNRISRLTTSKTNPDLAEPASELVLLDGIGNGGYQGGAFFFGKDGMLYAGSAHGGSQDPNSLAGKALRINPATYPNIIPADNPFVGKAGYREEIYALGFREPFTGAADMVTGNMVFNDVGEGGPEEINLLKKGANYGYEGGCEGDCTKPGMENPWLAYNHGVGNCITGAAFYEGNSFPLEYDASLFYADWGASWIKRRTADGKVLDFDTGGKIIQLDVGPDGSLYLLKINGENIPWTGSVQKVRFTGLSNRPAGIRDRGPLDLVGPEASLIHSGSDILKFRLGKEKWRQAGLEIFDPAGHALDHMISSYPEASLSYSIRQGHQRTGKTEIRFYILRLTSESGKAMEKRGMLVFLN